MGYDDDGRTADEVQRREDADYRIERNEHGTFTFTDKRTGHKYCFHDCVANGFQNNVYLYHFPSTADDPSRTVSYKAGFLNKDSLPEWIIEEFRSIHDTDFLTEASDPREKD